jgi:hypothetical protein|tara:strand:- start:175 stop:489 length:315 start_codon:yes stop_codon:yes gene_type:complete
MVDAKDIAYAGLKKPVEIDGDCQFFIDLENKEGHGVNRGYWNLICTKRDLSMYVKHNMKPHRKWKVTDVKKYFGIKGTGKLLLGRFLVLYNITMEEMGWQEEKS